MHYLGISRLCRNTKLPEQLFSLMQTLQHPIRHFPVIMVLQILASGRRGGEEGPSCDSKVGTVVVHVFVDEEEFLFWVFFFFFVVVVVVFG